MKKYREYITEKKEETIEDYKNLFIIGGYDDNRQIYDEFFKSLMKIGDTKTLKKKKTDMDEIRKLLGDNRKIPKVKQNILDVARKINPNIMNKVEVADIMMENIWNNSLLGSFLGDYTMSYFLRKVKTKETYRVSIIPKGTKGRVWELSFDRFQMSKGKGLDYMYARDMKIEYNVEYFLRNNISLILKYVKQNNDDILDAEEKLKSMNLVLPAVYTQEELKSYSINGRTDEIPGLDELKSLSDDMNKKGFVFYRFSYLRQYFKDRYISDIKKKYHTYMSEDEKYFIASKEKLNFRDDYIAEEDFDSEIKRMIRENFNDKKYITKVIIEGGRLYYPYCGWWYNHCPKAKGLEQTEINPDIALRLNDLVSYNEGVNYIDISDFVSDEMKDAEKLKMKMEKREEERIAREQAKIDLEARIRKEGIPNVSDIFQVLVDEFGESERYKSSEVNNYSFDVNLDGGGLILDGPNYYSRRRNLLERIENFLKKYEPFIKFDVIGRQNIKASAREDYYYYKVHCQIKSKYRLNESSIKSFRDYLNSF
jgi:hypothetical protein